MAKPVAEGGKGGARAAFIAVGAEQLDHGACNHVGIGQALLQHGQGRAAILAADPEGAFGGIGGELVLDPRSLEA